DMAEIMIESIGLPARNQLTDLLDSSEQEVRLRAARCLLNIGRDEGFRALRQIALDTKSPYRIDAIRAIMYAAKRNDAAAVARRLLRDADIDIRLEAYEQLRKFRDVSIDSEQIAGRFILEQVAGTSHDTIYVSRSGYPRIAIFGGPIYCKEDVFIQSSDGAITIDAQEGQNYVNVMRTMRNRPGSGPVTLRSSYRLTDIIRTLGADPISQDRQSRLGLAVPYAEIISMLKEMVEKDGVEAEFKAGPMTQISFK
ncbi:MAG: HEAT repeat domain-containing protein, partial [Phycisphaerae bacterium]